MRVSKLVTLVISALGLTLLNVEPAFSGACAGIGGGAGPLSFNLSIGFGCGTGAGTIGSTLCSIVSWFTTPGGIGSAIASLAVIFLGISAFFGKVTWGTAVTFAVGIFAIFGAGDIVSAILGGGNFGCDGGFF